MGYRLFPLPTTWISLKSEAYEYCSIYMIGALGARRNAAPISRRSECAFAVEHAAPSVIRGRQQHGGNCGTVAHHVVRTWTSRAVRLHARPTHVTHGSNGCTKYGGAGGCTKYGGADGCTKYGGAGGCRKCRSNGCVDWWYWTASCCSQVGASFSSATHLPLIFSFPFTSL